MPMVTPGSSTSSVQFVRACVREREGTHSPAHARVCKHVHLCLQVPRALPCRPRVRAHAVCVVRVDHVACGRGACARMLSACMHDACVQHAIPACCILTARPWSAVARCSGGGRMQRSRISVPPTRLARQGRGRGTGGDRERARIQPHARRMSARSLPCAVID